MSNGITQTNIQRRPEYIEGLEKTLLDVLFGQEKAYSDAEYTTPDPAGQYTQLEGGLLDRDLNPDLFRVPRYQIAAQRGRAQPIGYNALLDVDGNPILNADGSQRLNYDSPDYGTRPDGSKILEGDIIKTDFGLETFGAQALSQDADGDGIPDFMGRYMPYFESAGAYTTGGGEALGRGLGTIGEGKTFFGPAAEYVSGGRGMYDPSDYVSSYMNPYTEGVLDEVEKDIERQGNVARQRGAAQAVQSGAFGGSRQGVQAAEIEKSILDAKAKASADLRSRAYESALGSSMGAYKDANTRNLEAGRLMGGLGQSVGQLGSAYGTLGGTYGSLGGTAADIGRVYSALAPADIAFMSGVGADERAYRQNLADVNRQNIMRPTEQALLPYNYAYGALSGSPSANIYSTEQRTYSPGTNAAVAGLGAYTALQGINQQS